MADDGDYDNYERRNGKRWKYARHQGGLGFAYFLGMIGSAVYYLQHTATFWGGVIGLLKALVWPAFLVYHVLGLR